MQDIPEALEALKYFKEEAPDYHIAVAGSLLGISLHEDVSYPVGKVNVLNLYPMNFEEFLIAKGEEEACKILMQRDFDTTNLLHDKYIDLLRQYYYVGGMPEAVVALLGNRGIGAVESTLQDILDLYEMDFAKYAEARDIPRIHALWHSLPSQLSKENRKFIYKVVRSGARSKDYEDALMWLEEAGLIYRIYNISKPGMPVSAYQETNAFKVYACDCGLLRRLARLPATVVADPTSNYTEFKGAMAENAVLQSILPLSDGQNPCYWTSGATAEVEFVLQWGEEVIPVEVKAENNINGNSLSEYNKKYSPEYRVRFSMLNLQFNQGLLSCPAPLAGWLDKLLRMAESRKPGSLHGGKTPGPVSF